MPEFITNLIQGSNMTQWIVIGVIAFLFLTKKITFQDIIGIFLPKPTPTPNPDPNNPTPTPSVNLIQLLLQILANAKATNNDKLKDAVTTILPHACDECTAETKK